jgi:ribosome-binding factor A
MAKKRTARLNSLLKEVISDVIRKDTRNPHINSLLTITHVDITPDLHYAKVFVSVIGTDAVKEETVNALNSAAGFIAVNASKQVVMRYFPQLTFKLDDSVDTQIRVEMLLQEIGKEQKSRPHANDETENSGEKETSDES